MKLVNKDMAGMKMSSSFGQFKIDEEGILELKEPKDEKEKKAFVEFYRALKNSGFKKYVAEDKKDKKKNK